MKTKVRTKAKADEGDAGADAHEDEEGEDSGKQTADKVDQSGADQVAHPFHVGHDARDQDAGSGGIVEADGKTADMLLHLHAQVRDEALGSLRKQLGQRKRGDCLNGGCHENRADNAGQFLGLCLTRTLSTRNLVDAGRTRPQTRLMTISTNPNAKSHLRGLIRVQISGSTLRRGGLFFFTSSPVAPERERLVRSARIDIPAPALDRRLTVVEAP